MNSACTRPDQPRRPWTFTIHACARAAKRFGLIVDQKAQLEISRQLDTAATFFKKERRAHLYEIQAFGVRMIAVCDVYRRTIITFTDPKNVMKAKRKRFPSSAPRRKYLNGLNSEEE